MCNSESQDPPGQNLALKLPAEKRSQRNVWLPRPQTAGRPGRGEQMRLPPQLEGYPSQRGETEACLWKTDFVATVGLLTPSPQ